MVDIKKTSFEKVLTEKDKVSANGSPEMFEVTHRIGFSEWFCDDNCSVSIDGEGESYINVGKNKDLPEERLAFLFGKACLLEMEFAFSVGSTLRLDKTGFGYIFPTGATITFLPGGTKVEGMEKMDQGTKQFIKGVEAGFAELRENKKK